MLCVIQCTITNTCDLNTFFGVGGGFYEMVKRKLHLKFQGKKVTGIGTVLRKKKGPVSCLEKTR